MRTMRASMVPFLWGLAAAGLLGANSGAGAPVNGPRLRLQVDAPAVGASLRVPFRVTGWALDHDLASLTPGQICQSPNPSCVDIVEVRAENEKTHESIELGRATLGEARNNLAPAYGPIGAWAGFSLRVSRSLPAGRYVLRVRAHSVVSGNWDVVTKVPFTLRAMQ